MTTLWLRRAGILAITFSVLTIGVGMVAATPAEAATETTYPEPTIANLFDGGFWGPLIPCTGIEKINNQYIAPQQTVIYQNDQPVPGKQLQPCRSLCDILTVMQRLIFFALTILLYIIVPVMVFIGGFLILFSGANPSQRSSGINTIKGAVFGLGIGLGAFLIVNTFLWLIFNNDQPGNAPSYSYSGNALNKDTQGTRVTWPTIVCTPSADQPFGTQPAGPGTNNGAPATTTSPTPPVPKCSGGGLSCRASSDCTGSYSPAPSGFQDCPQGQTCCVKY